MTSHRIGIMEGVLLLLVGCNQDLGGAGTLTQWYFAQSGIMTQVDVQTKCSAGGQTFVAP